MESNQTLERKLTTILEQTNLFSHVRVTGDLDFEEATLTIEYQQPRSSKEKDFKNVTSTLNKKLREVVEQYLLGIEMTSSKPHDQETYQTILTRKPYEGLGTDTTQLFLKELIKSLSDKYLFR